MDYMRGSLYGDELQKVLCFDKMRTPNVLLYHCHLVGVGQLCTAHGLEYYRSWLIGVSSHRQQIPGATRAYYCN